MYQELDNDLLIKANELVVQGKHEAALLNYDEIISHNDQFYSHAIIQKVHLLELMGDVDAALAVCDEAIRHEHYYKFYELKADLQKNSLDRPLEADANYKQALAYLKNELSENSTNVYLYIEKGVLLKKLNQHLDAIDALNTAEQLTTNVEELGDVFYHKGQCYQAWAELIDDIDIFEKALESFEKARRHGKNTAYYIDHLTSYIRLNKALQQIEKKIAERPEIAKNYFDKAQILWEMPNGLRMYHDIIHLLDMAESLSKSNKEKGEICYLKYVYYKKKKELDAGHSFFDDKDTLSKKIDILKKAFQFYKLCTKKDNVGYDTSYIAKLLANYYAQLGDETFNIYFYKLAMDHFIFAKDHSYDPYYGNIFKDSEVGIRLMKEKLADSEYAEDDQAERTVEGVLYQSIEDANEARKEIATIQKIKENVDMSSYESVLNALDAIAKLSVETNIGKKLLKEIESKITDLDRKRDVQARKLPQLSYAEDDDTVNEQEFGQDPEQQFQQRYLEPYATSDETDQSDEYYSFDEDEWNLEDEQDTADNNQEMVRPTIFDDLEDDDDEYERFVLDESDPRVQEDLISIAEILQGDDYKHNESVAMRCLNQLQFMTFQTPLGAQFIHILQRIIADFDLKARTVNGVIYASRYEAQEIVDEMLDGHECDSEIEKAEVLRFHEVVEKARRDERQNLSLLNQIIPELNRRRYNKELLKPYLISLLDDKGKRELLSKLYSHQERTEMNLSTQIVMWALFFTVSMVLIYYFTVIGLILVAVAYPLYLFIRRGQEYLWKFFTNNGTIPISKYKEYFARPTLHRRRNN
jgi:tetratricopeptide (TPR) repeat protein